MCEDYPCCGHEAGECPDDKKRKQLEEKAIEEDAMREMGIVIRVIDERNPENIE